MTNHHAQKEELTADPAPTGNMSETLAQLSELIGPYLNDYDPIAERHADNNEVAELRARVERLAAALEAMLDAYVPDEYLFGTQASKLARAALSTSPTNPTNGSGGGEPAKRQPECRHPAEAHLFVWTSGGYVPTAEYLRRLGA